jgi:hypothetical protein
VHSREGGVEHWNLDPATGVDEPSDPGTSRVASGTQNGVQCGRTNSSGMSITSRGRPLALDREERIALICLPGQFEHLLLAEAARARVIRGDRHEAPGMLPFGETNDATAP